MRGYDPDRLLNRPWLQAILDIEAGAPVEGVYMTAAEQEAYHRERMERELATPLVHGDTSMATCSQCGHEKATHECWEYCNNPDCANHLVSSPVVGSRAAQPVVGFYGADPIPIPPQEFTQIYPVIQARPKGPITICFFFGDAGTVGFTYEEMLALQRVARAQIELEKRRGGRL